MEEEKKGAKFSRRSFLKGIGGGAIGTAVVSTGLIKPDPAAAYVPEAVGAAHRVVISAASSPNLVMVFRISVDVCLSP